MGHSVPIHPLAFQFPNFFRCHLSPIPLPLSGFVFKRNVFIAVLFGLRERVEVDGWLLDSALAQMSLPSSPAAFAALPTMRF